MLEDIFLTFYNTKLLILNIPVTQKDKTNTAYFGHSYAQCIIFLLIEALQQSNKLSSAHVIFSDQNIFVVLAVVVVVVVLNFSIFFFFFSRTIGLIQPNLVQRYLGERDSSLFN